CNLSIGLRHRPLADSTKYYVASVSSSGKKSYVSSYYYRGKMHARIRSLATYTVAIDTVAPTITPVSPQSWKRTGRITLKAKDDESGVNHYLCSPTPIPLKTVSLPFRLPMVRKRRT
ncbi:MAG: hypothetical protein IIX09_03770, partial [Clostridia bacterium]|nr:hypothetical protein [Clostridia bacterium]